MFPLLASVLLLGCVTITPASSPAVGNPQATTAPSTAPGASTAQPAAPETPWEAEVGNLSPQGERSLESALRLFSMAYGPLPGVEGVPVPTDRVEGTVARNAIVAR